MNPFKKWLRICLAAVVVIFKVAHCPRLFVCMCVFIIVCTFEKYSFELSHSSIIEFLYKFKCI